MHPPRPRPVGDISDLWREAARHEAASITAFTELADLLVRCDAPASLVERAHTAARDEVRHERICLALAGGGEPTPRAEFVCVPNASGPRSRSTEIVRLAVESFVDGLVGEGFDAARLAHGAATATANPARVTLLRMSFDERSHARLGTDIVAWCRIQAPWRVDTALRIAAVRLPRAVAPPASYACLAPGALAPAGFVDGATGEQLWAEARLAARDFVRHD